MVDEKYAHEEAERMQTALELKAVGGANIHLARTLGYYLYYMTDREDWETTRDYADRAIVSGDFTELRKYFYRQKG